MSLWQWILLAGVIVVVAVLIWQCVMLAGRRDRLHWRVTMSRVALDTHLIRRAVDAGLLAASGLAGQGSADLDDAAARCLALSGTPLVDDDFDRKRDIDGLSDGDAQMAARRLNAESALSRQIRACMTPQLRDEARDDADAAHLISALDASHYRVHVARSVHNLDVTQIRRLRAHPLVRIAHLYGHARVPSSIDFDDAQ